MNNIMFLQATNLPGVLVSQSKRYRKFQTKNPSND